jgi:hypothetical protein
MFPILVALVLENLLDSNLLPSFLVGCEINHPKSTIANDLIHNKLGLVFVRLLLGKTDLCILLWLLFAFH